MQNKTEKCCLVTICIGEKYLEQYNKLFRPSQENYAKRCRYDFKVITDYIKEPKHRNLINMNKWLLCQLEWSNDYDYIIFIDADVIINDKSPPIHIEYDFGEKIGVVNQSQPTLEARIEGQKHKGHEITAIDYYKKHANLLFNGDHIINSGVIVIQPKIHKDYLSNLVEKFESKIIKQPNHLHKDQCFFGYQLQIDNMHFFMNMKWNALWANNKYYFNTMKNQSLTLQRFYDMNYFIHLAGHCDYHLVPNIKY